MSTGPPAVARDPRERHLEKTVADLNRSVTQLSKELSRPHQAASDSDDRLSRVEAAVKWATPWRNLAALVAFFIVGGIGVYAALSGYAEDAVVETMKEAHGGDDPQVEPSVQTVQQIKQDVSSMKAGVQCLVAGKQHEELIKEVEVELELHRQQHAELMQEWSTKKALRRNPGERPMKTDGHLALEARLKSLTDNQPECPEPEPTDEPESP